MVDDAKEMTMTILHDPTGTPQTNSSETPEVLQYEMFQQQSITDNADEVSKLFISNVT